MSSPDLGVLVGELSEIARGGASVAAFRAAASARLERAFGFDGALWTPGVVDGTSALFGWQMSVDFILARLHRPEIVNDGNDRTAKLARLGGAAIDAAISPREKRTSAFWNEVVFPMGARTFISGPLGRGARTFLTITRSNESFTASDVRFFDEISPVLALGDELCALREPRACALELTARERTIVELVERGLTNIQIGAVLGISKNTVRNRLAAIFERLGIANRAELVARVHESSESVLAR